MAKKDLKEKEKFKRDTISKRISKFNKRMKEPVFMKMQTDMNKKAVLDNPEVDASKFPGFDQANRIRGGLKILIEKFIKTLKKNYQKRVQKNFL